MVGFELMTARLEGIRSYVSFAELHRSYLQHSISIDLSLKMYLTAYLLKQVYALYKLQTCMYIISAAAQMYVNETRPP